MNHNALTRGLYELNSFTAFMKIKKLWFSVTLEFVEQTLYGVTMEIRIFQHYFLVVTIIWYS